MKYSRITTLCLIAVIVLSGCQSASPEKKIHQILEATLSKENSFQLQQEPLKQLETDENNLFKKIMDAGMKNEDDVKKLSMDALDNLKKRKQLIDKEQLSILSSKKEFEKLKDTLSKVKNVKRKKEAKKLFSTMEERYTIHEKLYKNYQIGLDLDKQLYGMILNKKVTMESLEKKINETNKAFAAVIKANNDFNHKTELFNNEKIAFYKDSGIQVDSHEL